MPEVKNEPPCANPSLTPTQSELSPAAKKWISKILIIAAALLVFQIPLYYVGKLAADRKNNAGQVQNEIAQSWGGKQVIGLFPKAAAENISAQISPEIRYRGIYQAVVYTSAVKINAEYKDLKANATGKINLPDLKSVTFVSVSVNGKKVSVTENAGVLTYSLPARDAKCEISLTLRGSKGIMFKPNAERSHITVSGKWDSPSFAGDILPVKRSIDKDAFSGEWQLERFNANPKELGVNLCISAGTYQQVERCFTYANFFLIVFFFTLIAAELITKVNIHILQYLVAAGAPVLFYLMTLAFAEKLGFTAGYIVSAAVIVAMVTMYAKMFLGKMLPALIMGVIFAASYLLNFSILRMEDFALLSGTIILGVILGVLMLLTGKINQTETAEE